MGGSNHPILLSTVRTFPIPPPLPAQDSFYRNLTQEELQDVKNVGMAVSILVKFVLYL
jgi:hypothetical protein